MYFTNRAFNETSSCLNILLESCEYSDIYEYMWTRKLPYLGTVASLCNLNNLVNGKYDSVSSGSGAPARHFTYPIKEPSPFPSTALINP